MKAFLSLVTISICADLDFFGYDHSTPRFFHFIRWNQLFGLAKTDQLSTISDTVMTATIMPTTKSNAEAHRNLERIRCRPST